ncbi:MAG: hypothetical protein PHV39_05415, partial [Methanomicrobium sp.]|nr:hypothetical protein [Methanomicrobium sp.]
MNDDNTCGNYPVRTVLVSVSLELAIYVAGVFLVYRLSPLLAVFYIGFIAILLLRLLGRHCTDCYYYGKRCAFGKGKLSALLFKKGNPEKFCEKPMTPLQMIPDLLIFAIPFIAGIAVLVFGFEWPVLFLMI